MVDPCLTKTVETILMICNHEKGWFAAGIHKARLWTEARDQHTTAVEVPLMLITV